MQVLKYLHELGVFFVTSNHFCLYEFRMMRLLALLPCKNKIVGFISGMEFGFSVSVWLAVFPRSPETYI